MSVCAQRSMRLSCMLLILPLRKQDKGYIHLSIGKQEIRSLFRSRLFLIPHCLRQFARVLCWWRAWLPAAARPATNTGMGERPSPPLMQEWASRLWRQEVLNRYKRRMEALKRFMVLKLTRYYTQKYHTLL